jgi:hypothetical protein
MTGLESDFSTGYNCGVESFNVDFLAKDRPAEFAKGKITTRLRSSSEGLGGSRRFDLLLLG